MMMFDGCRNPAPGRSAPLGGPPPVQAFPNFGGGRVSGGPAPAPAVAPPPPEADQPDEDEAVNMAFLPPRSSFPPLSQMMCPRFTPKSFTFVTSLVQIVVFMASLIVGATMFDGAFIQANEMGGPSSLTFMYMGAKFLPAIKAGQVWRFFTPMVRESTGGFLTHPMVY
jgi:hypothetical protein